MDSPANVIRLVGGPPKLDGSVCDLRVSPRDRADAIGTQFVRAVNGSSVTSLAALQARCTDRSTTAELAAAWRALVYRRARARVVRRWRPAVYRFDGHFSLEPDRAPDGRWCLAVSARLTGPTIAPPDPPTDLWASLERSVDDAAGRFHAVAALVPDGLLAARVEDARAAVASCVADAVRLCRVGATVAPTRTHAATTPGAPSQAIVPRVSELIAAIDRATAELVELHVELTDRHDPASPVLGLGRSWAELDGRSR